MEFERTYPDFESVYQDEIAADYEAYTKDNNGVGLTVRITILAGAKQAYIVLRGDDENGDEFFEKEVKDIPIEWAIAITGHEKES